MIAEKSPLRFSLKPSRILFYANLWLALSLLLILISLPILLGPKLVTICALTGFFVCVTRAWIRAEPEELLFLPQTNCWQLSRMPGQDWLFLQKHQFVMSGLIIIYFKTAKGRTVRRTLPRDALAEAEHHRLRIFLVGREPTQT